MAPKIFLTGATGYIGGSVFHTLYTAHPDWSYTVLLRTVPPSFSDLYPAATIVRGDYDSLDAPATAAAISDADVVVHTGNSDHAPSLRALLQGLKKSPPPQPPSTPQKPTTTKYLIHLSGTGILSDYRTSDPSAPPPGTLNPRTYSDVSLADNTAIFLPPNDGSSDWIDPLHGETERIVYEAWRREEEEATKESKANGGVRVRTAIMRPPDIYGRGLGVARKTSAYVPLYVREILQGEGGGDGDGDGEGIGAAFFVGEGQNMRGWVHLEDLMGLYLKLVERA
ncbi:hypothetical protein DBV05_g9392, partial [Lasiodiplodia theobromae]